MKTINIENIFKIWGGSNQQLPDNHSVLKNNILSKHQPTNLNHHIYQKKSLAWLSMSFAMMAILIFLVPLVQTSRLSAPTTVPAVDSPYSDVTSFEKSLGAQNNNISVAKDYYPYPNYPTTPISDDREFIKINYNATIKTRHVEELTNRVQVVIRRLGGRVDASNSSRNYGYINFVVPASRFDSFKTEIKSITGARFYLEQINTRNLLPEKQTIEQRQTDTQKTIDSLSTEKKRLITNHNNTLNSLRANLNLVIEEMGILRSEITIDPIRQMEIETRLAQLADKSNGLNSQITAENKNYQSNLN